MDVRSKKPHPALKHGGYSATTILPGESAAEIAKLHRDLIVELAPRGALEEEIVTSIAHCLWRKRNLGTLRVAARAREYVGHVRAVTLPEAMTDGLPERGDSAEFKRIFLERRQAAEAHARQELGELVGLIEMGEGATMDCLKEELEVQSRLDAMIDRCIKRLLLIRGLKSMSIGSNGNPQSVLPGP